MQYSGWMEISQKKKKNWNAIIYWNDSMSSSLPHYDAFLKKTKGIYMQEKEEASSAA